MTETTIARRLAAILAADVVAYSRLMGADEDATMTQWWEYRREVIDPGIEKLGGRIVKHTGDGFLAEFASAYDAVNCALELQREINERSEKVAEDKRVQFRMGVNLGDIMSDDEDIYGDGVNIAARIEALADPGRVFVSGSVYEQIRSKPDFDCVSKGEHALKNISEPMRVFDVCVAGQTPADEIKV
ncbi:MAG: adenylate/guanylate cyclase domain-containing protein [Alphaproteobacteria bacterium]|jgi:adenylate cyclase|nr:adenylate/guanylate cyclase domain-containing protein [Alphaproteobacteria bacterium]MBT4083459.1 adenylate/guanylate cyclase domain-containing protein [Alphaproteobacteria bacterium]MBT4542889.1 adenylate/guanylate cyclase domain-containing protein [Alphaproteobacteria bacterium]MBT5918446.1 adenylate/guanylate cyclase domain-containing protein [Alphaproteobacteria bacterium]MBT6384682.1 adenylate/guanylate cyclase domain-containing protein [Alphaproteobacteria bacterium]